MHRTYRWLDAPPRLLGFSFRQWVLLVLAVGGGYGSARALHLPFKVAVSLGVFAIGLPAALAYLSEGDGLPVGRMVLDGLLWTWARLLLWARGLFGESVEQVSYLSGVPEHTWLGWMLHLMQMPLPFRSRCMSRQPTACANDRPSGGVGSVFVASTLGPRCGGAPSIRPPLRRSALVDLLRVAHSENSRYSRRFAHAFDETLRLTERMRHPPDVAVKRELAEQEAREEVEKWLAKQTAA